MKKNVLKKTSDAKARWIALNPWALASPLGVD